MVLSRLHFFLTKLCLKLCQQRAGLRVFEADVSYPLEPARRDVRIVWRQLAVQAVEDCTPMFARAASRLERPVRRYDPFAQRRRKAVEVQALVMAKPAFEEFRSTAGGVLVRLWPHDIEGLRYALRLGSRGAQKI